MTALLGLAVLALLGLAVLALLGLAVLTLLGLTVLTLLGLTIPRLTVLTLLGLTVLTLLGLTVLTLLGLTVPRLTVLALLVKHRGRSIRGRNLAVPQLEEQETTGSTEAKRDKREDEGTDCEESSPEFRQDKEGPEQRHN